MYFSQESNQTRIKSNQTSIITCNVLSFMHSFYFVSNFILFFDLFSFYISFFGLNVFIFLYKKTMKEALSLIVWVHQKKFNCFSSRFRAFLLAVLLMPTGGTNEPISIASIRAPNASRNNKYTRRGINASRPAYSFCSSSSGRRHQSDIWFDLFKNLPKQKNAKCFNDFYFSGILEFWNGNCQFSFLRWYSQKSFKSK